MLVNVIVMFIILGVSYQNVLLSSKLFNVIVKMYVVYYLIFLFIYLLYTFSHISLNSVIIVFLNLIKLNVFSYYLILVVSLIAFLIILNSINYLSYVESFYFIFLLLCFYLIMYMFIVSFNILMLFICWEYLGLVSYLLINYWLTRINCGIKTLLYNRLGDCCFLLIISLFYSYYYTFSLVAFNLYVVIFSSLSFMLFLLLMFAIVFFTKSAVLPFSSWLISAMSAPTPVSSLLHSSTMVIAGIIFGYSSFSSIIVYILFTYYYSFIFFNLFLFLILLTLLYSCFYLLYVSDIKSLIAYSTINQLTYIFFGLFSFNSILSIYHIITHAAFKSLLFLLAGSLIHVSSNYQSFYRLKSYCYLLKSLFIISLLLSLFNYSKELILNSSYLSLSLSSHFYIFTFCIIISFIYSLKLFVAIFSYNTSFPFVSFTSFILIFYGLTVLFIDSLFFNVFANGYVSLSYNSFNLSYNLIFNSGASLFPLSLFLLCYSFLFPFYFSSFIQFISLNRQFGVSIHLNSPVILLLNSFISASYLSLMSFVFRFASLITLSLSITCCNLLFVAVLLPQYSLLLTFVFFCLVVLFWFIVLIYYHYYLLWFYSNFIPLITIAPSSSYMLPGSISAMALVSYLNLLSLSYFNYVILIIEFCITLRMSSSSCFYLFTSISLSFIYSFIPFSLLLFIII